MKISKRMQKVLYFKGIAEIESRAPVMKLENSAMSLVTQLGLFIGE